MTIEWHSFPGATGPQPQGPRADGQPGDPTAPQPPAGPQDAPGQGAPTQPQPQPQAPAPAPAPQGAPASQPQAAPPAQPSQPSWGAPQPPQGQPQPPQFAPPQHSQPQFAPQQPSQPGLAPSPSQPQWETPPQHGQQDTSPWGPPPAQQPGAPGWGQPGQPPQSAPGWGQPAPGWGPPAGAGVPVASLGRRASAYVLDGLLVGVIMFVVVFVVAFIAAIANGGKAAFSGNVNSASDTGDLLAYAALNVFTYAIFFAYLARLQGRQGPGNGQTLGKKVLGLRVIRADGGPIARSTARRRAAVLVAPALFLPLGALLDALAGTPPTFTSIGGLVCVVGFTANLIFAPLSGELRDSFGDRIAGTHVVRVPEGAPFGLLAMPRPKTGTTMLWGGAGGLYVVLAIAVFGYLATTSGVPAGSGGGVASMPTDAGDRIEHVNEVVDGLIADGYETDTSRAAVADLAEAWSACIGEAGGVTSGCLEDDDLGFPPGTLSPGGLDTNGGDGYSSQISAFDADDASHFLVYDGDGFGWGFRYKEDRFELLCMSAAEPGSDCTDDTEHPGSAAFLSDLDPVRDLIAAARGKAVVK